MVINLEMENVDVIEQDINDGERRPSNNSPSYNFNSTLAQCFATLVTSLSFMMLGIFFNTPTVVIGDLSTPESSLPLTIDQSSWYASLLLITQPIGCMTGGFLQTFISRKYGMVLMNVLAIISLIFTNQVNSVSMLNMSSVMMGITLGFVEAPGLTYVTEISEPRFRGTLAAYINFSVNMGTFLTFLLALFINWRQAALITVAIPVLTLILLFLVPDSPYWLLNKGREEEALKALCWLRGGAAEDAVEAEFQNMRNHVKMTQNSVCADEMHKTGEKCSSTAGGFQIRYLFEASTLRPLILLLSYQFFSQCASTGGARNYLIQILRKLNVSRSPEEVITIVSIAGVAANLITVMTVNLLGKRFLSLMSMVLTSLSTLAIGIAIRYRSHMQPYCFIVLFAFQSFCAMLGILPLPWILLGEIFPNKSRSIAAGLAGASYYLCMSLVTKTYPDLELMLNIDGCFILYALLGFVGVATLWRFLPETEGKRLFEIEQFFSNTKKR